MERDFKRLLCPVTSAHVRLFAANLQQILSLVVRHPRPAARSRVCMTNGAILRMVISNRPKSSEGERSFEGSGILMPLPRGNGVARPPLVSLCGQCYFAHCLAARRYAGDSHPPGETA